MTAPHDPGPDGTDAYVVVPSGTGRRGRGPLLALGIAVAVVAGLTVWGALVAPDSPVPPASPNLAVVPSPGASSVSSPTPSTTPRPALPALPLPSPREGGLPAVDAASEADAFAILATAGGWRQCPMWRSIGDGSTVRPADAAAAVRGVAAPRGMVQVDDAGGSPQKLWIGASEDDAARGFGGSAIVHVHGAAWTLVPDGSGWAAIRLQPMPVDGRPLTAWQVRARAFPAPYCLADSVGGPPARVVEVPIAGDPLVRLYAETGWFVCRTWQRMEQDGEPDGAAIDAAAAAAGIASGPGWVTTRIPADDGRSQREVRVYVGDDPAIAATRQGAQLVVLGSGEPRRAWLATSLEGRPFAVAFDVVRTPAGRTAWLPTASAAGVVGDCPVDGSTTTAAPGAAHASQPTVELLRGERTASALLSERLGWQGCRMVALDAYPIDVPGQAIDDAATAAGLTFGPLPIEGVGGAAEPLTVFLGEDVVDLARWTGDPVVALDGRPVAWLADETRADEWRPIATPAGRTAWLETGAAAWPDGGCEPPPDATPDVAGVRSLTCWLDRARCVEAVLRAIALAPSAFTDATEVAVGVGAGCAPNNRCEVAGPSVPVYVTAAPAGWASPGAVRVFSTTQRRLSGTPGEVPPAEVTPPVLALATRPSAALPVPEPVDRPPPGSSCTGETLRGVLRGDPWDPRVAWVGDVPVLWPAADAAVFLPDLRLVGPDAQVVARAGDEVRLVGRGPAGRGDAFEACAVEAP